MTGEMADRMERPHGGLGAATAALALAFSVALALALACLAAMAPGAHAELTQLSDGTYEVPVTMTGGTGKASISSPATVTVSGGETTATIVWSSPNYDKMTVAKQDYAPTTTEGGSTFEIPVTDDVLKVKAETTAMGTPHTIDYTITFDMANAQVAGSTEAGADGGVSMGVVVGVIVVLLVIGIALGVASSRRKARR